MTATTELAVGAQIHEVPVDKIHPDPKNPRGGDLALDDDFLASIAEHGVRQPVILRPHPERLGEWMLVSGHRRHGGARRAQMMTIPAILRQPEAAGAAIDQLIENVQREDLSPLAEGRGYWRLVQDFELTQEEVARLVGRSPSHVSKRIALTGIPVEAQRALDGGHITIDTGLKLAGLVKNRNKAAVKAVVQELQEAVTSDLADIADGKETSDYDSADSRVGHEIAHQEREAARIEKVKAARKVIADAGLELIDDWSSWKPGRWREARASETPKAATIARDGKVTRLISNRVKDPNPKPSTTTRATPENKDAKERRALVEALAARRAEHCADLVRTDDGAMDHVARYLIACEEFIAPKVEARALLELDKGEDLDEYASTSTRAAVRVARALVLADGEAFLAGDMLDYQGNAQKHHGWGESAVRLHYRVLTEHGYELDPFEKAYLGAAPPKAKGKPIAKRSPAKKTGAK